MENENSLNTQENSREGVFWWRVEIVDDKLKISDIISLCEWKDKKIEIIFVESELIL